MTGRYVNYRKQLSPPGQPLLPEAEFRLYAVCSRYPHNVAHAVPWQELEPGFITASAAPLPAAW